MTSQAIEVGDLVHYTVDAVGQFLEEAGRYPLLRPAMDALRKAA
jgi:hypothetical protein